MPRQLERIAAGIAQLAASGAGRFDPARFRYLQRQNERLRQQRHCSQRSLQRLEDALDDYRQRFAACREAVQQSLGDSPEPPLQALLEGQELRTLLRLLQRPATASPLNQLLQDLGQRAVPATPPADPLQQQLRAQESALLAGDSGQTPSAMPPRAIRALGRARTLRREQQRRERIDRALNATPSDAGPLNSHRLVVRAISTLQQLSPAYLEHFINHVETLMALEKLDKKRAP